MFGTLVSTDSNQGTLEYIENPDPVAAVSRNIKEKVHIACMSCRSGRVWPFELPILYLQL